MPTLPTDADFALSALMNGLESGLDLGHLCEIYMATDDAQDFDEKVSEAIELKELSHAH